MRDLPAAAQVGVYGYLLGGLGYALLGRRANWRSDDLRHLAHDCRQTVGEMAGGDAQHYAQTQPHWLHRGGAFA